MKTKNSKIQKTIPLFAMAIACLGTNKSIAQSISFNPSTHYHEIVTDYPGVINIGCANTLDWAHINTSKTKFFIGKPIHVNGGISSYNTQSLQLMTNGITRIFANRYTGNVGIGTTAPSYKLDVNGNSRVKGDLRLTDALATGQLKLGYNSSLTVGFMDFDQKLYFRDNNNNNSSPLLLQDNGTVAIGTVPDYTPNTYFNTLNSKLYVEGNTHIKGALNFSHLGASNNWNSWEATMVSPNGGAWITNELGTNNMYKSFGMTSSGWYFGVSDEVIGSATTDIKYAAYLENSGKFIAREIEVTLSGWADFVFEKDYDLLPLSEVEQYIDENNHLPGVPSEEEVLENGVNLGEMNAILLKKIEELTLYVIELEKKVEQNNNNQ